MPFQKGNTEASKAKKAKAWSDALRVSVNQASDDGGTKLRELADKLVSEALNGNIQALKEIGDRIDGKVAQQLNHADNTGEGPLAVQIQRFTPPLDTITE